MVSDIQRHSEVMTASELYDVYQSQDFDAIDTEYSLCIPSCETESEATLGCIVSLLTPDRVRVIFRLENKDEFRAFCDRVDETVR